MSKITKHLRLQLDFTIEIDDSGIPTNGIQHSSIGMTRTGDDAAWRDHDDRMRRLYAAIVAHSGVFEGVLLNELASYFSNMQWQDWSGLFLGNPHEDLEDILPPAIAMLSKEDQEIFARAKKNEVFFEQVEDIIDCFKTTLHEDRIVITDMDEVRHE